METGTEKRGKQGKNSWSRNGKRGGIRVMAVHGRERSGREDEGEEGRGNGRKGGQ